MDKNPIAVVGIGNAYRSDDGVGLFIAEQIRSQALKGVKVVVGIGDGFALVDAWSDSTMVFVIDCASSGAPPGITYRFDALRERIPNNLFSGLSTHSIAVNDAVELARVLNRLSEGLVVYGIEGSDFSSGTDLTPAVQKSALRAVRNPFLIAPNVTVTKGFVTAQEKWSSGHTPDVVAQPDVVGSPRPCRWQT